MADVDESGCEGCLTYNQRIKKDFTSRVCPFLDDHPCPCSNCIIKMMCRAECDLYVNFRLGFPNYGTKQAKK
jgi:hypothetical protein